MSFDGTNDYVSIGQSQIFRQQNLTIEAWIKPRYDILLGSDAVYGHDWGSIVNCRVVGATNGWFLGFNYRTGQLHFIIDSQWVNYHSNKAVWYNNTWYHVALTFDQELPSGNLKFYVNGTLDSQHDDKGSIAYGDTSLQIGAQSSPGHFYGGLIDEVRVWNISRVQIQIQGTLSRILSIAETASPNLVGYWRFDEGAGTTSEDYSKYGNDAVLASSPANPLWSTVSSPITYELSTLHLIIALTSGGTTNPTPGSYPHVVGTVTGVQAVPSTGYILSRWELDGANAGSANPFTIMMDSNHTLQAVFSVAEPSSGLVGYWKFDEGTGNTAVDSSGNGNTCTLDGSLWVDGKSGKALSFNGVNNYVKMADNILRSSVTPSILAWFQSSSYGAIMGYQSAEYPGDPGHYAPIIYVGTDGKMRGQFWAGAVSPITTAFAVNDNNWHHVALIGNTNTQSLYLDGNLVGTLSGTIDHLDMSVNYVGLCKWHSDWPSSSGTWGFFNGKIDEVRIYHRALSQQEIRNVMGSQLPPSTNGMGGGFALPWPLSTILIGSVIVATLGIGSLVTIRSYKRRRPSHARAKPEVPSKREHERRRARENAEKEVKESNFVKGAQYYSEVILTDLKETSEVPRDIMEQYCEAIRCAICQQALRGDKKSLGTLYDIQKKLRSNKPASITGIEAHMLSQIDPLLEVARKVDLRKEGDLDRMVDAALREEAFQKWLLSKSIFNEKCEVPVSGIAKEFGYGEQTTKKLLSKGVELGRIKGRLTNDKKVFYSKEYLTRILAEDLRKNSTAKEDV